jgi:hypothetical protein
MSEYKVVNPATGETESEFATTTSTATTPTMDRPCSRTHR